MLGPDRLRQRRRQRERRHHHHRWRRHHRRGALGRCDGGVRRRDVVQGDRGRRLLAHVPGPPELRGQRRLARLQPPRERPERVLHAHRRPSRGLGQQEVPARRSRRRVRAHPGDVPRPGDAVRVGSRDPLGVGLRRVHAELPGQDRAVGSRHRARQPAPGRRQVLHPAGPAGDPGRPVLRGRPRGPVREGRITEDPATWEEFAEDLEKVKAANPELSYAFSDRWTDSTPLGAMLQYMAPNYSTSGGWGYANTWYDQDDKAFTLTGTTDGYKDLVTQVQDYVASGVMDPEITQSDDQAIQKFVSGASAAISGNTQEITSYRTKFADAGQPDVPLRMIVLPGGPAATTSPPAASRPAS
ncbi:extracellular solute-binding protein [Oerskovia sp. M15]